MRASTLGLVVTAALAFASISATLPVSAQPQSDDDRARMHFQAANAYFQTGDYDAALREFTRSFELSRRPGLYYNLALCHERLGNLEEAIANLERYLAEDPDAQTQRATLEARIANLRPRLEQQRAREAAEAERARRLEEEEARRRREEEERRRREQQEPSGGGLPALTWIGWIGGGVGLITFGVFGALTVSAAGDLADNCVILGSCTMEDVDQMQTYALIADIGLVVGVVGVAVGTTFLFLSGGGDQEREPEAAASVSFTPWLTPDSGGAAFAGRF